MSPDCIKLYLHYKFLLNISPHKTASHNEFVWKQEFIKILKTSKLVRNISQKNISGNSTLNIYQKNPES